MEGIAYGGDWNPEQWDRETNLRDIERMVEAGVNLISLGIFSWASLEPEEGHYDLEWLADLIDQLHSAGIGVDLANGTASPPVWMAQRYPQTLPVDSRGVRLGFGSRQQYNPSSELFCRKACELTEAMARRFGDHPGVVMWHISNEYACHTAESFDDESAAAFRRWLVEKYGDLQAINRAWGTAFWSQTYRDIQEIQPPRAMPTFYNPGQMLDWRRFSDYALRSQMEREREVIRRYSDRPITTNFMGTFPLLDYRKWAPLCDIIADDSYPDPADPQAAHDIAWQGDVMRGLSGGAPWLLMEQSPGAVQWRPQNSPKRPGQFLLWTIARLAHGADGILQFQWRQSAKGSETFHAGMVPHSGEDSPIWTDVVSTGQALKSLAPITGTRMSARAAVVIDWESEWARHYAIGPISSENPTDSWGNFAPAKSWHQSLWEAGIATDVVGVDNDFTSYDLIIVPAVFIDYPNMAHSLRIAAERGAQVVITAPSAVVDSQCGAILGGYLGSLASLAGVKVVEHSTLTGPSQGRTYDARESSAYRISGAVETPAALNWCGIDTDNEALKRTIELVGDAAKDLRSGRWAEKIVPAGEHEWRGLGEGNSSAGVECVAYFDGRGGGVDLAGACALSRNRVGQGSVWYAAADFDALSRSVLVRMWASYARLLPVFPDLPRGVEAQEREGFLFLLNHSDRAVELSGIVGKDLLSGSECTGHVVLAPRSALVVER